MRVRFQQQCEHSECGLACVSMIIDYFIKKTKLSGLRERYGVPNGGYNLLQLQVILKENGVDSKAVRINSESVSALPQPFIAYWDSKHFVVVERVSPKYVYLVDPAIGKKKIVHKDFDKHFSGIALYMTNDGHRKFELPKIHTAIVENIRNNKKLLFFTFAISLVLQCLSLLIPYVIQNIIDQVDSKIFDSIKNVLFIIGLLIGNYFVFYYLRTKTITNLQTSFDKGFLGTTIKQMIDLPYSFFVNRSKGELVYRINSNSYIRQVLIDQVIELFINVFFFFLYLIIMFLYNEILAFFTIIVAILLCFFSYVNAKVNRKISQNEMIVLTKSQDLINEIVNNIFTIKATNSQKNMYGKWKVNFDEQILLEKEKAKYSSIFLNITHTMQIFYPLIIYLIGYKLISQQKITLGGVVAFSSIGASFLSPLVSIMSSYSQFLNVKIYIERLLDILDTQNETLISGTKIIPAFDGRIELKNVTYKYSEFSKEAILDISLVIKPYEKVAIVGASGSGKSTLLKVMACLYQATSGNICYDDYNVEELDIHSLRERIGIVLQENMLFSGTFRDNITMGRSFTEKEVIESLKATNLIDLLNSFPLGLDTNISESGQNLSGGQRQRIAIARTIIAKPRVIFLDEPTSSLDNKSEKILMENLFKMKATLVVVAHRLSTIEHFDKIIVMDQGKIAEIGTHNELIENNKYYADLYKNGL